MAKKLIQIQYSSGRSAVLLLCGFLLGVLLLFAEETVESCATACRLRYQSYYDDCRVAYSRDLDKWYDCNKIVTRYIGECTAACGL